MQLHAVIVPPPGVVQAAVEAARGLVPPPEVPEVPKPGLLGRLRGGRRPEPVAPHAVMMAPLAPDAVFVRLAKFGNVTVNDAADLADALQAAAGTWRAPVLHVSKVTVADAGPYDVTAQLEGDVDALRDIYREVNEVARTQRFFLDRRSFRSVLALGSIGMEDGSPVPDSVAGAEQPHEGARWSPAHVTLLRSSFNAQGTTFAEVAQIELADVGGELGAHSGG